MKKILFVCLAIYSVITGCSKVDIHYAGKVIESIDSLGSVAYFSTYKSSAPFDDVLINEHKRYVKEVLNSEDSILGRSFFNFEFDDTAVLNYLYDGVICAWNRNDKKIIEIDSLSKNITEIYYIPFFVHAKEILSFGLQSKDTIDFNLVDYGDSLQFTLVIEKATMQFAPKPRFFKYPDNPVTPNSNYEIWIDKKTNLPFKICQRLPFTTNVQICDIIQDIDNTSKSITSADVFPAGYKMVTKEYKKIELPDISGTQAPEFSLLNENLDTVALDDINGQVILLQFTSIGCGPCQLSVPYLNELHKKYGDKGLTVVSIESSKIDIKHLKRIKEKKEMDFAYLLATKEVVNEYQVNSFPAFFILDENKVIKKVFSGFGCVNGNPELAKAIEELF